MTPWLAMALLGSGVRRFDDLNLNLYVSDRIAWKVERPHE